jgi:proline iminopeptidase
VTRFSSGSFKELINGTKLHFTIQGSGPALIAHSGGPGWDARGWGDMANIHEHATVITIHPRGSGLSDTPSNGVYALADYALDLEALRQLLGIQRPIIMGWSHGGFVAQEYAVTYPRHVLGLILIGTCAHFGRLPASFETTLQRYKSKPWYAESLASLMNDEPIDRQPSQTVIKWLKFYFKDYDQRAETYLHQIESLPVNSAPMTQFGANEWQTLDFRHKLSKVKSEALVIAGRYDFMFSIAMAEELARSLPGAVLEIFEESGHMVFVEEPEKFNQVVGNFIKKLPPS